MPFILFLHSYETVIVVGRILSENNVYSNDMGTLKQRKTTSNVVSF
jgi:hypothetical protein